MTLTWIVPPTYSPRPHVLMSARRRCARFVPGATLQGLTLVHISAQRYAIFCEIRWVASVNQCLERPLRMSGIV